MNSKFTEKAKRALNASVAVAEGYGHTYIGSEHLLLALMQEEGSCAHAIMKKHRLTKEKLDKCIKEYSGSGTRSELSVADTTPRCKRIIEAAYKSSRRFSSELIGTEHLLLALLEERECVGVRVLLRCDADVGAIKEDTLSFLRTAERSLQGAPKTDTSIPNLTKYGKNLTALAASGAFDPLIGREKETERLIRILTRKSKNNPCLIGEAGVGKTAIVEGLATRIAEGRVPPALIGKIIISVDLTSMVAGAKYRGDFEERIKSIMEEASKNSAIILFIDELHTIVGAGSAEGAIDAANIMKPELSRGDIRIIGATTLDEYRRYIEKDGALERRFQPISIEEPTVDGTLDILYGLRERYERHHGLRIEDSAIEAAARLSDRYIQDRFLPDKAIDLLDETCAKVVVEASENNPKMRNMENKLRQISAKKESAIASRDFESAMQLGDAERIYSTELAGEAMRLKQARADTAVTETDVRGLLSEITGIELSGDGRALEYGDILAALSRRIIGQSEAITSLSSAVRRSLAGINDPERPRGIFMLLGESGVGKTETARALAEALFGADSALISYDMSEYSEPYSVSKLIGSAPGYVGHEDTRSALETVRRRPYSVVLLDEAEKAHPDVMSLFLQIFDKGYITDAQGRRISFRNTYILLTSNVGARSSAVSGFAKGGSGGARERLKGYFRDELINRLDEVILFASPTVAELESIAKRRLDTVSERVASQGYLLRVGEGVAAALAREGVSRGFGARPLLRLICAEVENPIADLIVAGEVKRGDTLLAEVTEGGIRVSALSRDGSLLC